MEARLGANIQINQMFAPAGQYLLQPIRVLKNYNIRENIQSDMMSGLTVAVILLPQAIAFAIIADLPPQMGLYAGIVGAVIGALFCSSDHMQTGPTNAMSLLVFGSLTGVVASGTTEYIIAAGLMAVMAGVMQLVMGLARLGMLVNFVSHSVIVGFSTGAGILIAIRQLSTFFGLSVPRSSAFQTVRDVIIQLPNANTFTTQIGIAVVILLLLIRWYNKRLPSALITMVLASIVVFVLNLDQRGVATIGELPTSLPPLANLPLTNIQLISDLSAGALAVGAIGLVQTMAISRSFAAQSGQRIDSNQEFVAQGMANIFSGFFTGYSVSGSFARTAVNYKSGARSPMAALFSGLFVLIALLTITPLAAFLPRTALAAVLIVTAYGMIDQAEIKRIIQSRSGDTIIMLVTLFGTLFLDIEFAVLSGIVLSLLLYIYRTSTPRVHAVVPDPKFKHFTYQPDKSECVQLAIIEIKGDLYFGAVNHVEDFILDHAHAHPAQRFLLLRMHNVNHMDFSGIHMLENVVRAYRAKGGNVFMVRVNHRVKSVMVQSGFDVFLGHECIIDEDEAIDHLFHRHMDPAVCIYECPYRVFKECQNLPKRADLISLPSITTNGKDAVHTVSPGQLWEALHEPEADRPYIVDVREPREFRNGHIVEAQSIPLADILKKSEHIPKSQRLVLVCRTGRRSRRAAYALQTAGYEQCIILDGGMQAWEAEGKLEAIDR